MPCTRVARHPTPSARRRQQLGAVLVITMVLLIVVTLLGLSAISNTQTEVRMSANSASNSQLRQGAESVIVVAVQGNFPDRPEDVWQRVTRGDDDEDALPPGHICAAGQWRVRRLGQSGSNGVGVTGTQIESANFEIEAECYQFGDANGDGVLDAADGPRIRLTTGVTLFNNQNLSIG